MAVFFFKITKGEGCSRTVGAGVSLGFSSLQNVTVVQWLERFCVEVSCSSNNPEPCRLIRNSKLPVGVNGCLNESQRFRESSHKGLQLTRYYSCSGRPNQTILCNRIPLQGNVILESVYDHPLRRHCPELGLFRRKLIYLEEDAVVSGVLLYHKCHLNCQWM